MKITELAYLESCVNQGKEKTQKVRYLKQVIMSKFKNNFHCLLRACWDTWWPTVKLQERGKFLAYLKLQSTQINIIILFDNSQSTSNINVTIRKLIN